MREDLGKWVRVINPEVTSMEARDFICHIEQRFSSSGTTIYKARNEIKVIGQYNVKKFALPSFFNRVIYSSVRTPKARRAYDNALSLKELGISTPTPLGYVLHYRTGLLRESYLITEQITLRRSMYEFGHVEHPTDSLEVLQTFGRFTAMLHERGVLHLDYSPGNILFDKIGSEYSFALVDVNRLLVSSAPISIEDGVKNMRRLWGESDVQKVIAYAYADARDADQEMVYSLLQRSHDAFWRHRDTRWIHSPYTDVPLNG